MKTLRVIVNKNGGTAAKMGDALIQELEKAFAKAGATAEVAALDGKQIPHAIEAAARSGRVTVAGGDGTAAGAAQILAGSDTELSLLPLGTLNHLARDLGIPADLSEAAKVAVNGQPTAIDVGEVNGQVFVNNASIGLYPLMVRKREGLRRARGWPKWLSTVPAALAVLERLPHHRLRLDWGKGERAIVTPLLFVGNNVYSLDRGEVGQRGSLTDGKLSVYAVAHRRRAALIWFAMRALVGRAERSLDFETLGECETLSVSSSSGSIEIALDGELRRIDSPLEFRIRAGALTVITPGEAPQP
ncbi:diacylglycerol kinase family protein [Sphingomonas sp.]|uniref:diacylglycerol/lipid kinase family protein n=1 Tax=Sphingomonas sp. TaxID=28214 RepID=UPI0025DA0D8B|nr:diacylglycerol kinase family protein [Sphingomonas sp.]